MAKSAVTPERFAKGRSVDEYVTYVGSAENLARGAFGSYFPDGGADALVNVAGAGVVNTTNQEELALRFVDFLFSDEAQQYFANETDEYPLVTTNVAVSPLLKPLSELNPPQIDLGDLSDLQGTLEMLQDVGALQ